MPSIVGVRNNEPDKSRVGDAGEDYPGMHVFIDRAAL